MFFCCSDDCRYFKWGDECPQKKTGTFRGGVYEEGESSGVALAESSTIEEIKQDIARAFRFLACISEKEDVEISLNVTFHKGKGNVSSWAYV